MGKLQIIIDNNCISSYGFIWQEVLKQGFFFDYTIKVHGMVLVDPRYSEVQYPAAVPCHHFLCIAKLRIPVLASPDLIYSLRKVGPVSRQRPRKRPCWVTLSPGSRADERQTRVPSSDEIIRSMYLLMRPRRVHGIYMDDSVDAGMHPGRTAGGARRVTRGPTDGNCWWLVIRASQEMRLLLMWWQAKERI